MIRKITDLTPIATNEIADSDLIEIVDRNDDTMSVTGTNKSVTTQDLANYLSKIISEDVTVAVNSDNNAVHITQGGGGNALLVSDEEGDSSPFVITSVGDVGIGTQLPTTKLHVAGNTAINGNISILKSDGTVKASITSPEENAIAFSTALTERIRIDASGNVGIGTSDPVHRLDVVGQAIRLTGGSSLWNGIVIKNSEANSETSKGAFFDHQNENNVAITSYNSYSYGDGSADLIMSVTPAGDRSTDRRVAAITVKGNGNVAIGASNTSAKLGVVANSGGTSLTLTDNVNSTLTVKHESPLNLLTYQGYGTTTQRWTSLANDSATPVEHMRITSTGNVGIGTNNPTNRLVIANSSQGVNSTWQGGTDYIRLFANNSNFSEQSISFQEIGTNIGAKIGVKNKADGAYDIIFANRASGSTTSDLTEKMRITSEGNVAIGTTNQTASRLEINSSATSIATQISSPLTPSSLITYGDAMLVSTCGADTSFRAFTIGGTVSSPTAVLNDSLVGSIRGFGYNGNTSGTASAFNGYGTGGIAAINFRAKGNQTSSNSGSYMTFVTSAENTINTPVERMRIDDNGVITTPAMPAFYGADAQIANVGIIKSYTEVFDRGNNFNPVTGVFTAPAPGIYYFTFHHLLPTASTGDFRVALTKNDDEYHRTILHKGAGFVTIAVDGHIQLQTGDTVSAKYISGPFSVALYTPGAWSKFSGHMIG